MPTPQTFYEDGTISVTATSIKGPAATIYLDQVSSVSFISITFFRTLLPMLIVLGVMLVVEAVFLGKLLGHIAVFPLVFTGLPLVVLAALGGLLRKTTLKLQTTGGQVVLAHQLSLTAQPDLVARCEKIKSAIERAKAAQSSTAAG